MAKRVLEFNLVNILKKVRADKPAQTAFIPLVTQEGFKREFGERAIDTILNRTLDGKDKQNSKFVKYSKAYITSKEFEVYGKDKGLVNLKLTGEMQSDIEVVGQSKTSVRIGFVSDEQWNKAKGHIDGGGNLPIRDFWGLSEKEQKEIMTDMLSDFNTDNIEVQPETSDLLAPEVLDELLGELE